MIFIRKHLNKIVPLCTVCGMGYEKQTIHWKVEYECTETEGTENPHQ